MNESTSDAATESEAVYVPDIAKKDYNCDFNIVFFNNGFEDGTFYVSYEDNMEKLQDLTDKIMTVYHAESTWLWPSSPTGDDIIDFTDGTSLFRLFGSADLYQLRSSDLAFGILPYPLYDERQESDRSMSRNGQMAVPASVKNTEMAGDVLEILNYFSAPVTEAYYERLLGAKLSDAPDDTEMLNTIWDSQVSNVGLVFSNASPNMMDLLYMIPNLCEQDKGLSAFLKANVLPAQRSLDRLFDQDESFSSARIHTR